MYAIVTLTANFRKFDNNFVKIVTEKDDNNDFDSFFYLILKQNGTISIQLLSI